MRVIFLVISVILTLFSVVPTQVNNRGVLARLSVIHRDPSALSKTPDRDMLVSEPGGHLANLGLIDMGDWEAPYRCVRIDRG